MHSWSRSLLVAAQRARAFLYGLHFYVAQPGRQRLVRRSGLLILNLQLVHHLLHIRNRGSDRLDLGAQCLGPHFAGQSDNATFDIVLYTFFDAILG
jgi:hypothetical protein